MNWQDMFLESQALILRTILQGVLGYLVLVVLLLVSGKRTLSKWNAFDFVITIALGSALASTLLSRDTSLVQGVVALATLILLQFIMTFVSVRSEGFQRLIKSRPTLLLFRGQFLEPALVNQRVTTVEVRAAVRAKGFSSLSNVFAVVLETDGSFSVIPEEAKAETSALEGVQGYPPTQQ